PSSSSLFLATPAAMAYRVLLVYLAVFGECQKCPSSNPECFETEDVILLSRKDRTDGDSDGMKPNDGVKLVKRLTDAAVPCTYSKTYAYPAGVKQQDSGGISQMDGRCTDAGEDYVDNTSTATCIFNSNSDGYDYDKWKASQACPYPAGATEYPIVTTQAQCEALFNDFIALGDTVTMNGRTYHTGIGHGVLNGVRGNCFTISYNGKYAVIFQVDIRSWSLEITLATLNYLLDDADP
ncbi:PDZ domain-containing protein, partial [Durusdinium trenchii]